MNVSPSKQFFPINPYSLLVGSLGLATVSLGQISNANIRIWEVLLPFVIASHYLFGRQNSISNRTPIILAGLFFFSVLLSFLNCATTDAWLKQASLLLLMLILFAIVAQRCSAAQLVENLPMIVYPGILIGLWGIVEVVLFPESLPEVRISGWVMPRAQALFVEPNEFSQYLSLPFAFLLSDIFFNRTMTWRRRLLYYLGLCVVITAQMLSYSRGGLLAFIGQAIALSMFLFRSKVFLRQHLWYISVFAALAVCGVLFYTQSSVPGMFSVLIERIQSVFSDDDPTTEIRRENIRIALGQSALSPLNMFIGSGIGTLTAVLGEGTATTANHLADVFVEIGIIGVMSFCSMIIYALYLTKGRLSAIRRNEKVFPVFVGSYLAFVGLIIGGLTYATHMLNIFWFVCGLLMACQRFAWSQSPIRPPRYDHD